MPGKHHMLKRQVHNPPSRGRAEQKYIQREDCDGPESHSSTEGPDCPSAEQKIISTARSRTSPDPPYSTPSSEEKYEGDCAVQISSPATICKRLIPKTSKDANRTGRQQPQNRTGRAPMFPPLDPPHHPRRRIASAQEQRIKRLHSEVWDLQRQLAAASQENRLLRRVQSRHAAALRRYQDAQASLPQTLHRHNSETRALRELLRGTRTRGEQLERRLRCSEAELLRSSHELGLLRTLSQDRGLEERHKLSKRLSLINEDLQQKNKRIQDLERNLALSNSYFNRQLSAEMGKTVEARELSKYLENQINDLTQRIKEREKELQIHNIYSHRFPKGRFKRGARQSKSVQTDGASPPAIEDPPCILDIEYPVEKQSQTGLQEIKNDSWEPYTCERRARSSNEEEGEQHGADEERRTASPENGKQSDSGRPELEEDGEQEEEEEEELSQASASEHLTLAEDNNKIGLVISPSPPTNKAPKSPVRFQRYYNFKETIQNLHSGKPAYGVTSSNGPSFSRYYKPRTTSILQDTGAYEPSFGTPAAVRSYRKGPQPAERPHSTRKSNLLKELFGQVWMVEQMPGVSADAEAKTSNQD